MEVRLLGPVEVHADDGQLPVRGPIQRALVAMLALHANRVVASQELLSSVWGPEATAARRSLQWQVWQLRRLLGTHADRLVYRAPGYLLRVKPGELDLERFQDLADQGRQALAAGDAGEAGRLLGAALGLWRGQALEDVQAAVLVEQHTRLEQRRLAVAEDRVQADLDGGRHVELVVELEGLVAAQPLRERLCGLLMVALYRSGRQADALAAFRALRRRLVEQQGLELSPPLQELHQRILAADPALDPPVSTARGVQVTAPALVPVPRQLPPDVAGFTGRTPELLRLQRLLAAAGGQGPAVIAAIQGTAGIGKSALAVHAAHRLAGRFPDGQLYVDLHGATTCTSASCPPGRRSSCSAAWPMRSGWRPSRRRPPRWPAAVATCRWRCGSPAPGWRRARAGRWRRWPSGWPTPIAASRSWSLPRRACGPASPSPPGSSAPAATRWIAPRRGVRAARPAGRPGDGRAGRGAAAGPARGGRRAGAGAAGRRATAGDAVARPLPAARPAAPVRPRAGRQPALRARAGRRPRPRVRPVRGQRVAHHDAAAPGRLPPGTSRRPLDRRWAGVRRRHRGARLAGGRARQPAGRRPAGRHRARRAPRAGAPARPRAVRPVHRPQPLAGLGAGQPDRPPGRPPGRRPGRRSPGSGRPRPGPLPAGPLPGGGVLQPAEPGHPPGTGRLLWPGRQPA
jgi:DNA-binding SARP family transcriptional activator